MKDLTRQILKRELTSLDAKSKDVGLELDDMRKLDLIIKAYRSWAAPDPDTPPTGQGPAPSTEDLLKGLDWEK